MVSRADRERLFGKKGEGPRPQKPIRPPQQYHAACGHLEKNRMCQECRKARWLRKLKAQGVKQAAKQEGRKPNRPRLPDGSNFRVVYDAAKERWVGRLVIGGPDLQEPPQAPVFDAEASGVFALLTLLDDQYREWLSKQPRKPAGQ